MSGQIDIWAEAWKTYGQESIDFVEKHRSQLEYIVRQWTSHHHFEECWHDVVVWKTPRIIETWDPCKAADLKTHVYTNLRWYVLKWIQNWNKHQSRHEEVVETEYNLPVEAAELLDGMSEFNRVLIQHYVFEEFSPREIATANGWTVAKAREYISYALEEARCTITNQ